MTSKTLVRSALALLTVTVLSACGADDGDTATPSHNDADIAFAQQMIPHHAQAVEMADMVAGRTTTPEVVAIAFAQQMIPHHAQAVEMADMVAGRTTTPEVVAIAERVKAAQEPEIATLTGWLAAWGASSDAHADHDMPGMMADGELADLRAASGADFDQRWLSMMVVHHQGAIEMAETELADGLNPDAKALAGRIAESQRAEIREMQVLLPQG